MMKRGLWLGVLSPIVFLAGLAGLLLGAWMILLGVEDPEAPRELIGLGAVAVAGGLGAVAFGLYLNRRWNAPRR
jgi:hypothetical protein